MIIAVKIIAVSAIRYGAVDLSDANNYEKNASWANVHAIAPDPSYGFARVFGGGCGKSKPFSKKNLKQIPSKEISRISF